MSSQSNPTVKIKEGENKEAGYCLQDLILYLIIFNNNFSQDSTKSKADLRRERRAVQEEQRAKKAAAGATSKPVPATKEKQPNQKHTQAPLTQASEKQQVQQSAAPVSKPTETSNETSNTKQSSETEKPKENFVFETAPVKLKLNKKKDESNENLAVNKLKLFHHFDQYKRDYSITEKISFDSSNIHPEFIKLGLLFAHDKITSSNARCIAFLNVLKHFVNDYKAPTKDKKTISEHLESKLKPNIK